MPADKKILDRVEKLLRLAAPTSGSTEAEQSSAALEAAKLIGEHDLVVRNPEPKPEREPPRRNRHRDASVVPTSGPNMHKRSMPHWVQSVATSQTVCPDCGGRIVPGQNVWMKSDGAEFVHRNVYV